MMLCPLFLIDKISPNCGPYKKDHQTIKDTDFRDFFSTINVNTSWCTLEPLINQAVSKYIQPFVCSEVICCLAKKWKLYCEDEDSNPMSSEEMEALRLLKLAAAWYGVYHAMPMLNLSIGEIGIQEQATKDGTSIPTAQWRFKNSRGYICNCADSMLDDFIKYIKSLPVEHELRKKFDSKDCNCKKGHCFFGDACDFQECIDIKDSHRTFVTLIPHIKKATNKYLLPIICKELMDKLCDPKEELDECYEELIELIRPMLASWALYEGLFKMRVNIENDGIYLISSNDGISHKKEVHDKLILELRCQAEKDAKLCQLDLCNYLEKNKEKFPEWTNSDCYEGNEEEDSNGCCRCPENEPGGVWM